MTFDVLNDASEKTYPITVYVEECCNEKFEDVSFSVVNGSVKVDAKTSSTTSSTTESETEATQPTISDNSTPVQNGTSEKISENVQTGENANTLPWFAFIASTFTMGLALALNKFRKLKGRLF